MPLAAPIALTAPPNTRSPTTGMEEHLRRPPFLLRLLTHPASRRRSRPRPRTRHRNNGRSRTTSGRRRSTRTMLRLRSRRHSARPILTIALGHPAAATRFLRRASRASWRSLRLLSTDLPSQRSSCLLWPTWHLLWRPIETSLLLRPGFLRSAPLMIHSARMSLTAVCSRTRMAAAPATWFTMRRITAT